MPEKPEVLTVVKVLKERIVGKTIQNCEVYWANIIAFPEVSSFCEQVKNQKIQTISCRGKWIVITLDQDALLIHLRMEGKFFFRNKTDEKNKHEHVIFTFTDDTQMRFADVRKFGKMYLIPKDEINQREPLKSLGYEYFDEKLNSKYLKDCFSKRKLPIKTVLLDQSIIAGIGNIYDDEILFMSHIHPLTKASELSLNQCDQVITNTKTVLEKAIQLGGTTIRSYTSEEGVHGLFQNELLVHGKKGEQCPICQTEIKKITVGGRGTYYCPTCQKEKKK